MDEHPLIRNDRIAAERRERFDRRYEAFWTYVGLFIFVATIASVVFRTFYPR